jgi:hypothetical protein
MVDGLYIDPGKGHIMASKTFILISLLFMLIVQVSNLDSALARPKEYTVFEVRKTLPLNDKQPVFYDYYVNMGTENGVKEGDDLAVYRKIPIIDIYRNKAQGDMVVEIARVKVIHVQKTMSVVRIIKKANPKKIPVVPFERIMMGDRVEQVAQN